MATPFASLEAIVNAAVFVHLANATATFADEVTVDGVFDNGYAAALEIGGSDPTFRCLSSDLPAVVAGSTVAINSTNYVIAGPVEQDGTGIATLNLREA